MISENAGENWNTELTYAGAGGVWAEQVYEADLIDISKTSITVGFSQNFDIFNQKSKLSKNSIKKSIQF